MITTKALENLKNEYEKAVTDYVAGYNSREVTKKTLKQMKKYAASKIEEYNLELSKEQYRVWDKQGDAVKTAIRERFVPDCVKVTYKTTDDTDIMVATYSPAIFKANLPMMQATIGADKFADADWFARCEKLAWIVAGRLNKRLGDNPNFNYEIAEATKSFDFPYDVEPFSDAGVMVALQEIFDSILFIPDANFENVIKVTLKTDFEGEEFSPEWTYIRESVTHQGKEVGMVAVGNTGKMSELVADAMHINLTHGDFSIAED